jgi:lysophospholipase
MVSNVEARRVLVLYTGGTIGMREGPRGYVPEAGFLSGQLRAMPAFADPACAPPREPLTALPALPGGKLAPGGVTMPLWSGGARVRYDVLAYEPLLDSSNMGVEHWVRLAEDVARFHGAYDAFVVLHGTDTMAWTASALSFMLEGLDKPVILTGSQIPLVHVRNDAVSNLLGALMMAAHGGVPEVGLWFHHRLLRGNRARKVDAAGFDAFQSANVGPLAELGVDLHLHADRVRPKPPESFRVRPITRRNVATLRVFPGLTRAILSNVLAPPLEGLVLETYGSGNVPDRDRDLLDALAEASARGVVIVNVTQCARGAVTDDYAAGRVLREVGVVPGADMTTEAALTKLAWLLSLGLGREEIASALGQDLRGELTRE